MQEKSTSHGFELSTQERVATDAVTFENVLREPWAIARWNGLTLKPTMDPHELQDVGSYMEFMVRVGPLVFDYVMITSSRIAGHSLSQRTTKGFVNVTITYSWEPAPEGLLVTVVGTYRFTGSLWWKIPVTRAVARRYVSKAAEGMREMFAAGPGDGAW